MVGGALTKYIYIFITNVFPSLQIPSFHSPIWSSDFPTTGPKCPKTHSARRYWADEKEKNVKKKEKRKTSERVATKHSNMTTGWSASSSAGPQPERCICTVTSGQSHDRFHASSLTGPGLPRSFTLAKTIGSSATSGEKGRQNLQTGLQQKDRIELRAEKRPRCDCRGRARAAR